AFCLTEPSSGSDAYSIKTKASKDKDGNYIVNGQKLWITNGGLAGFYTVFCKTEHEQDGKAVEKISCFIVEKEREGISFGAKENKMGIRASETRAVYFDNVKIPASNMIGEEGKGFKIAMNVLNSGRLSLGAGCVGGMKSVLELATKQAASRKQFDRYITEFGLIQEKISVMAAKIYSSESVVYFTTGLMDRGLKDYHLESAICKVFNSEALWEVVDMALQIAAGSGYMKEYPFERIMRDSRINLIFEGTNEVLRAFIALSGMRAPSVGLKELGKMTDVPTALKDPIKSLGVLTDFAMGRISKFIGPSSITKCHPELSRFAARVPNMVSSFSIHVENTLMKYGKKIVDHEMPLKRISNMVTDIYATLATLSRTTSILESESIDEETKNYVTRLNNLACSMLYKDFKMNSREMDKNKDKVIKEITENVVKNEGYGLDIIDF
ncbi:MAG: acyl-CoA dehydrogenase family protein, partial [Bdellovibrionales bacterium]|nr:acyl-CoA dehydrogenase family protein [Bdellovibrionales bacterium]